MRKTARTPADAPVKDLYRKGVDWTTPKTVRTVAPLVAFALTYGAHKGLSAMGGRALRGVSPRLAAKVGRGNPLIPATIVGLATWLATATEYRKRQGIEDSWEGYFENKPETKTAAEMGPGYYDASYGLELSPAKWTSPSIGVSGLRGNIWAKPGFTRSQRLFMNRSVDKAVGGDRSGLISPETLGAGVTGALYELPKTKDVARATADVASAAATGAFLGKAIGWGLGMPASVSNAMAWGGGVAGTLKKLPVLRELT